MSFVSENFDSATVKIVNKTEHLKSSDKDILGYSGKIEILFCCIIIFYNAYFIFTNVSNVSQEMLNDEKYENVLWRKGWFFNYNIDLTDEQFYLFRKYLFLQIIASIIFLICSYIVKQLIIIKSIKSQLQQSNFMCFFYFIISFCFEIYIYGIQFIFVLIILIFNYFVAKFICSNVLFDNRSIKILFIWIYNLYICYFILQNSDIFTFNNIFTNKFGFIDNLIIKKIDFKYCYRFMFLKIISFEMDKNYYHKQNIINIYNSQFNINYLNINNDYNLLNYLSYMFYLPLHIVGPIISFHDWLSQIKSNLINKNPYKKNNGDISPLTFNYKFIYFLRLIFCFFINEIILHFCYTHCMSHYGYPIKNSLYKYIENFNSPIANLKSLGSIISIHENIINDIESYIIGLICFIYLHLNNIWLKFLLIWRFARFISLLDNIYTIENIQRCMTNNNSIINFWKYWHSSFNLFNKRYIYIPLRKNNNNYNLNKYFIIILIFIFTSLWHGDFNLSLIVWGLIMGIAIIPEILISKYFKKYNVQNQNNKTISRYIVAFGGTINILILIFGNMIGYGPGLKNIKHLFLTILTLLVGNNFIPFNKKLKIILIFFYCILSCIAAILLMFHLRYLQKYKSNIVSPLIRFAKWRSKVNLTKTRHV